MKITGGDFRGRPLAVPKGIDVRPTQDRVREALFNMLQHAVPGASFLDLFAGSGAVGLEALSRGAASATLVELSPRHVACIQQNIAKLGVEARARAVRGEVREYLARQRSAPGHDIVFADPPYELGAEMGYAQILETLAANGIVKPGGLFIAEMKCSQEPDVSPEWELCRDRTYGQTRLAVYRRHE